MCPYESALLYNLDKSLVVLLLGCRVILFLSFWGNSTLFSRVATPVYIPTTSAKAFLFLHILTNNVYSSTFNNSQIMERVQMSTNWWMDKKDVIYIYNGILLGNEKEWNPAICNNVDGTRGYYAKWSKSVRERHIVSLHSYMEFEKLNRRWWREGKK